jgi:hypothetical protein
VATVVAAGLSSAGTAALLPGRAAAAAASSSAAVQGRGTLGDLLGGLFGGRSDNRSDTNTTTRGRSRDLRATITTDRNEYGPDRSVAVTMTLTNTGDRRVFVNNAVPYELIIREERRGGNGGQIVWQSSRHGAMSGLSQRRPISFDLEPGQTRTYRERWDQTDGDTRRRLPSGVYRVEARIAPQDQVSTQIYLAADRRDERYDRDEDRYDSRNIRSELRVDPASGTIRPGDTVRFEYAVTNTDRSRPRTFRFSSGRQFDMYALFPRLASGGSSSVRDRIAWQFSADLLHTQALTQFTLEPGERRTFRATWRTPRNLPAGSYTINAFLTPRDENAEAYPARATVRVGGTGSGYDDYDYDNRGRRDNGRGTIPGTLRPGQGGYDEDDRRGPRRGDLSGRDDYRTNDRYFDPTLPVVRLRDLSGYNSSGRDWTNRYVTVSGVYRGVNPRGYGNPPVRSSDWLIEDGSAFLYVTNGAPLRDWRTGQRITISGVVRRNSTGGYYLEVYEQPGRYDRYGRSDW